MILKSTPDYILLRHPNQLHMYSILQYLRFLKIVYFGLSWLQYKLVNMYRQMIFLKFLKLKTVSFYGRAGTN